MTRRTARLAWAAMLARDARLLLALFPSDGRREALPPTAHGEPRWGEAP